MLHRFMTELKEGIARNLSDIARSMDISPAMAARIADDLTRMGYLEEISPDCIPQRKSCADCPTSSGCNEIERTWFLTKKGRAAVSDRDKLFIGD